MKALRALGAGSATLVVYLGVPLLGWGLRHLGGFFMFGPRAAHAVLVVLLGIAIGIQAYGSVAGIRGSRGEAGKRIKRQTAVTTVMALAMYGTFFCCPSVIVATC
jgi:hypothetical protein